MQCQGAFFGASSHHIVLLTNRSCLRLCRAAVRAAPLARLIPTPGHRPGYGRSRALDEAGSVGIMNLPLRRGCRLTVGNGSPDQKQTGVLLENETYISTIKDQTATTTRISKSHGHKRRAPDSRPAKTHWTQKTYACLSSVCRCTP